MSFNDPVQCVTAFSGDSILGIAAGCQVHVIDFAATRTMSILENHKKTVTSCCAGSIEEEKYLLSGSLDHLVKVYEMNTFTVRKTFSYSAPILSLAMSVLIYLSLRFSNKSFNNLSLANQPWWLV